MNIAVDARELCGKPTGVGRYLSELLTEWRDSADAQRHSWTLYAHETPQLPAGLDMRVEVLPGAGGTAWEQWTLARAIAKTRPDVLFAPGYTAPLTAACPIVLVIHDVSFAAHPEWFSAREGLRRRLVTRAAGLRAARVLTVSEFSKREIVTHLSIPAERIRVTPHGSRLPLIGGPMAERELMVLYVGSIFERRNVETLMEVFLDNVSPQLPDATLEIVGEVRLRDSSRLPDVANEERSDDPDARSVVQLRAYVDERTLEDLYARASVFAFLSDYEGFGLTPLEALARGVAPVVLDTAVSREVYGEAARYVPPGPGLRDTLGDVLLDMLANPAARERVLRHAPAVLSRYDWERTAATTLTVLEEAAGAR
ncbi:MAG: glycosyltransferase family 4 protein [Acidobacteria bacterium]|nr:glycosyltransferase family 4 protein [Acidobacteriota bacterium]